MTRVAEAETELLMHPYFSEKVAITPEIFSRATREKIQNGRPPRQAGEETIEVDMEVDTEVDEATGNNIAEELEERSQSPQKNTTTFDFNPNSSGIETSIFNFTAQDVPPILSTRTFEDRVETSSLIQQSI